MNWNGRIFGMLRLSLVILTISVASAHGAIDSRFELDPQSLGVSQPEPVRQKKETQPPKPRVSRVSRPATGEYSSYTIKPGDNLFKILMRDYGLTNSEAESFIEVVRRENKITDIRNLKVGSTVIIPPPPRKSKQAKVSQKRALQPLSAVGGQTFHLDSPDAALSELEASVQFRQAWDKMMPPPAVGLKPVSIQSPTFSLTFDPSRYPLYAAMNGLRILVDRDGSIPPLVKELISEKDPSVRIVTESPASGKRFISSLLDVAGFYSVEEEFGREYGTDPIVSIRADFKVEKTADSVLKQDVMVINSGKSPYPRVVRDLLKKDGITAFEPFAVSPRPTRVAQGQINQIRSRKLPEIVDGLLGSLAIIPEKNKLMDIFAGDNNGISLSIRADRYFERSGHRHVITQFDGDPVAYTLYRLLETKGYRVAILEAQDDFRKVTEKLLSQIRVQGSFARHQIGPAPDANYSLRMSGYRLDGAGLPPDGVIITNLELDPAVRELLIESGFGVTVR